MFVPVHADAELSAAMMEEGRQALQYLEDELEGRQEQVRACVCMHVFMRVCVCLRILVLVHVNLRTGGCT